MQAYLLRRVAQAVLTLVGMSVLVFVILRVLPGDPAKMLLPEGAPQSAVDELNRQLGLKEPLHVQYGIFLKSVFRGDFGQSFQYRAPALLVVRERLPATLQLTLCAMVLTVVSGVTIGIVAAVRRGTRYDYAGTILAVLGQSLPSFWLGIMLVLLFGVTLRWLPTSGLPELDVPGPAEHHARRVPDRAGRPPHPLEHAGDPEPRLHPDGPGQGAGRAGRCPPPRAPERHHPRADRDRTPDRDAAGRRGHHGIGLRLAGHGQARRRRDLLPGLPPVVQTVLILSATIFVVINLLVDALYTVVDPRIRYR